MSLDSWQRKRVSAHKCCTLFMTGRHMPVTQEGPFVDPGTAVDGYCYGGQFTGRPRARPTKGFLECKSDSPVTCGPTNSYKQAGAVVARAVGPLRCDFRLSGHILIFAESLQRSTVGIRRAQARCPGSAGPCARGAGAAPCSGSARTCASPGGSGPQQCSGRRYVGQQW